MRTQHRPVHHYTAEESELTQTIKLRGGSQKTIFLETSLTLTMYHLPKHKSPRTLLYQQKEPIFKICRQQSKQESLPNIYLYLSQQVTRPVYALEYIALF